VNFLLKKIQKLTVLKKTYCFQCKLSKKVDKTMLQYWTIRYVPDPVRVDTVGVGVVVTSATEAAARFVTSVSEIPAIGGDRKSFLTALEGFQEEINARPGTDVTPFIERVRRQGYNTLQVDAPRLAAGDDVEAALDDLYMRMIARPLRSQP
jgi:hypothetical protein